MNMSEYIHVISSKSSPQRITEGQTDPLPVLIVYNQKRYVPCILHIRITRYRDRPVVASHGANW